MSVQQVVYPGRPPASYFSNHFNVRDVIGHIRCGVRDGAEGERAEFGSAGQSVLHIPIAVRNNLAEAL